MTFTIQHTEHSSTQNHPDGAGALLLSVDTLVGNDVVNCGNEKLGDIKALMLNTVSGNVCYAVVAAGGILGIGEKLYAVPWRALVLDTVQKRFVLDVDVDRFKDAPGFDKEHWPNMADSNWAGRIHSYFGTHDKAPRKPDVPAP